MGCTSLWLTRSGLIIDILGAFFVSLDILGEDGLVILREILLHLYSVVKKARVIPLNYLQLAYFEALSGTDSRKREDIYRTYSELLKQKGIDDDYLRYQLLMRSLFFVLYEGFFAVISIIISSNMGALYFFTKPGYRIGILFLFLMIAGLFWYSRAIIFWLRGKDDGRIPLPTFLDFGPSRNRDWFVSIAYLPFNALMTVVLKFLAGFVRISIFAENITRPNQAPRVLGFIFLFLGFALQLVATFVPAR